MRSASFATTGRRGILGLARDLAAMGGFTITSDCFGELICCPDEMYAIGEAGKARLPAGFFLGLFREPLRIEAPGAVHCMAARLRAWSVGRFLPGAPATPWRGWSDARDIFGPRLALVVEMVGRRDWRPLAEIFDRMLIAELDRWEFGETGAEVVGPFLGDSRSSPSPGRRLWGRRRTRSSWDSRSTTSRP